MSSGELFVTVSKHSTYTNASLVKIPSYAWDAWETITLPGEKEGVNVFIEQHNSEM